MYHVSISSVCIFLWFVLYEQITKITSKTYMKLTDPDDNIENYL